ncbi:putative DNA modification/repair radical SAM protein [Ruminococcaceae bacterium OttesenSCG-928-L11]|nr:putative DNA modification/repair radical SAM protein [Ruminococcaceae bacterium OttesenSCG-928-L11]
MANIIWNTAVDLDEKVRLMREDARFEVADDASGVPELADIRSSVRAKKAPPTVPKVFLSNDCIFNCAYCGCRSGRDCARRYQSTPRELAELAVSEARRANRGIFLTSAIIRTPDYTQELMIETMKIIRGELNFQGYVHSKVMPGTAPELIHTAGLYADRLSVNIEVARSEGYKQIAKNKNKTNILGPMGSISRQIEAARAEASRFAPPFATSQTTQMMAGSSGEDDYTILRLSGALYRKYHLSRVYYTAFHYQDPAAGYEELPPMATPLWRVRRLYQADRLMQLYGFAAEEIVPEATPALQEDLDPKVAWALRNLHLFPVEVNRAGYEMLLRVPGIGVTYAKRIVKARQYCALSHDSLQALGVSLKRARHFIVCKGKYQGETCENPMRLHSILREGEDTTQTELTGTQTLRVC